MTKNRRNNNTTNKSKASNPFSDFVAGSSSTSSKTAASSTSHTSGGWLTTKKRGRDDLQIEHDRANVERERKIQRQQKRNKNTSDNNAREGKSGIAANKKSSAKRSRGRKNTYSDSESEDSFIADGSEEEEDISSQSDENSFVHEEEESSDSDDEQIVLDDDDSISEDDDNDNDDSIGEDAPQSRLPPRKKPPLQSRRQRTTKKATSSAVKRSKTPLSLIDSSSDEEEISLPLPERKAMPRGNTKSKARTHHRSNLEDLVDDGDDDDSIEVVSKPKASTRSISKTKNSQTLTKSPYFSQQSQSPSPIIHKHKKRILDSSSIGGNTSKPQKKKNPNMFADSEDDDSEEEDTQIFQFTDNSDTQEGGTSKNPRPATNRLEITDSDLCDTDEECAIAMAMQKSLKDINRKPGASYTSKAGLTKSKKHDQTKNASKSKIVYKDDLEDDEEENDDEQDCEPDNDVEYFETADEREASSVLIAAKKLRNHIVQVTAGWNSSDDDNISNNNIADGVLSISSSGGKRKQEDEKKSEDEKEYTSASSSKLIISNAEMQRVCPKLKLGEYQLVGVNWMALLHNLKFEMDNADSQKKRKKSRDDGKNVNGVLADEMGLGKTVQTIAFLAWLKYRELKMDEEHNDRPHIIIVPASVLSNWQREFEMFCPEMVVVKYHGTMDERKEIKNRLRRSLPVKNGHRTGESPEELDVVLTTFSYFSSEKSDDRNFLKKFKWNYMVVDEAHCLKNPKGARYKNMDNFTTERRLLLTGTPVQNSPKELMSLLCFLMPLFTSKGSNFDDDDDSQNDGGARMLEHFVRLEAASGNKKLPSTKVTDEEAYRDLKQLLAPFVLRRTKKEVLSQMMPPKTRVVEWVPFDDSTRAVYDSILSNHMSSKNKPLQMNSTTKKHIFTELRKAANHPLLLRTRHTSQAAIEDLSKHLFRSGYFGTHTTCTQDLVKKQLEIFSDYDIHCAALELIEEKPFRVEDLQKYTLLEQDLYSSPKFQRLKTMIPELIEEGHRILIFSQWTRCLDLLTCFLDSINLLHLRLDGSTSIPERQGLIDKFNNDPTVPVFLLSTRAGGMGINLTAADTCILHDLDFNPFNDLQAEDRCHRIGQKKPVKVIKMVTEKTVDADIYKMQERKAKMNAVILENGKKSDNSTKEMSSMLQLAFSRYEKQQD